MSIRLRLTLWYTVILAGTLILFGIVLYVSLTTITMNQYKQTLQEQTDKIYQRIEFDLTLSFRGWDLDIQLDEIDSFMSKEIYLQVANLTNLRDLSAIKVKRSSNAVQNQLQIPITSHTIQQAQQGIGFFETSKIKGFPFLTYNKPIVMGDQLVGILQASMITGEYLKNLRLILVVTSLLMIILASSFGWFLARKALKPIDHVIHATDQIEKGADLEKRILYDGPHDEIGRLVDKINGMLSRIQTTYTELEEAYRAQRRFVSDASHELRTPLTTIRGNVELIHKMWTQTSPEAYPTEQSKEELSLEAVRDIADEAERMSRLVDHLLSLARADAGYEITKEQIEMKPFVLEVIRKSHFLPKNVDFQVGDLQPLDGVTVWGNQDYLQQMLFIFIENAFKYTPEGTVQISAMKLQNQIGIQISDTGVGMEKDEIPHIFERFYRADVSRGKTSGTGLGLSIAKWIIDEHNGSVEVKTMKDEGTTFIIWLPIYFKPVDR